MFFSLPHNGLQHRLWADLHDFIGKHGLPLVLYLASIHHFQKRPSENRLCVFLLLLLLSTPEKDSSFFMESQKIYLINRENRFIPEIMIYDRIHLKELSPVGTTGRLTPLDLLFHEMNGCSGNVPYFIHESSNPNLW